ncbi:MAG: hypothetical protein LBH57_07330 [Treponema sp.]|nr:hypothetical protein [Treponema sp.]
MYNGKRARALALGLFLYLLLSGVSPLGAGEGFSFPAEAGSLWVEDDGAALYWRSGLSFKKDGFYAQLTLGQVVSSLPWADGAVFGGLGKLGFDTSRFGLDVSYGFFKHALFSSETETFSVYNDGGRAFFVAVKAPLRIGEWSIAPSFLYGSGAWTGGSLYWFFGKPKISALTVCGLSLGYHERHELAFHYIFMDADILNNDAEQLFDSRLDAYTAYYRLSLEIRNLRLGGSLGWFYATAGVNGALTASNQHFVYFPYNFYAVNGSLGLHAGFGAVELKQAFSFFQYRIMIGAAHIFPGNGAADIHHKKKTLFGGEEVFDKISLDIGGTGAAFILLDAGPPSLRLGTRKKVQLSLGLKKLFVVPWGYKQILPGTSVSTEASNSSTNKLLKTVLLSGLSLYGSLYW